MRRLWIATVVTLSAVTAAAHPQVIASSSTLNRITVTGCVERAATHLPTPTSTTGIAVPETKFLLAHATTATPIGTPGTVNGPISTIAATLQYRLDDSDEAKVSPFVGHRVEISGSVDDQSQSTPDTLGPATTGAPSPKLRVDSIRTISSTCLL